MKNESSFSELPINELFVAENIETLYVKIDNQPSEAKPVTDGETPEGPKPGGHAISLSDTKRYWVPGVHIVKPPLRGDFLESYAKYAMRSARKQIQETA